MRFFLPLLLLLLMGNAVADNNAPPPLPLIEFTAIINYEEIEGGFYTLVSDNGNNYTPLFLPELFRQEGLRVRVTAELRPTMMGFHQRGSYIRLLHIIPSACIDEMRKISDN
jgi:hypothetical protein